MHMWTCMWACNYAYVCVYDSHIWYARNNVRYKYLFTVYILDYYTENERDLSIVATFLLQLLKDGGYHPHL